MYKIDDIINKVHCADCLSFMKQMPDNCVDLVLTDPPYGINYTRHIKETRHIKIENDNDLKWLPEFISQTSRILKSHGNLYVFCSWHNVDIFKVELSKFFSIRNMLVWDKGGQGMGDLKTTYGCVYELCFFANTKTSELNGKRNSDVIRFSSTHRTGNVYHPTQKPTSLMGFLIEKSSKEGDVVFDSFLGSGTTAVSCKELNRKYIGIEINPEYCKIAEKRIFNTQGSLF